MTRTRGILLVSTLIAIAACAPKPAPVDTSADVEALKKMPPGEPAVNGTEALRKWFEAFTKDNSISGKYTSADVQVAGDWGVVHYTGEMTVTPKKGGKPMTEVIKGVHIYKRQADGAWKIAQDVWNSDAPPPPPPK